MPSQLPAAVASGSQQMDPATQALCFFYRNPPRGSGVKPQPYKKIPQLIKQPRMEISRIKMAVKRFGKKKKKRGRKVGWRKGRAKKCRGGKSATMMYAYAFTLCRRAVVVTLDLSARNLHMFTTDHWLSNPLNVLVLRLTAPA